jgi:hypothetical protein
MTVALQAFPQFLDNAGVSLSGGKLFSFQAGTLTPLATFTDRGGGTPNANPVVLDSAGRADIWLSTNTAYKLRLEDAVGNVLDTIDDFYAGADPSQLTAAGIVPATGGTYTGLVSFTGGATFDGTAAQDLATLDSLNIASVQNANLWMNPDGAIWQRSATPSVADATYGFDQVVNLCDTGSITLSQVAQPLDGIPFAMRQTQPDAAPKRFGFTQIAEVKDCIAYRGKNLAFALRVRCSASTTIRCALVAWTGAQDAPTRDVVNNWASTTYTAGNFFVASVLPIAVTATAVTAATWTDLLVSSVSAGGVVVPSTTNNLYMVVWTDAAQAQNVTLDASVIRCGQGTVAPLWTPPNADVEFHKCQRYYEVGAGELQAYNLAGNGTAVRIPFKATKRATPTLTYTVSASTNCTAFDARGATPDGLSWFATPTATGTIAWIGSWTASAGL